MNYEQFHNALRVLRSIDKYELPWMSFDEWDSFSASPYLWFIRAPDEFARRLFQHMERRMGLTTTSASTTWDTSSSISPPELKI